MQIVSAAGSRLLCGYSARISGSLFLFAASLFFVSIPVWAAPASDPGTIKTASAPALDGGVDVNIGIAGFNVLPQHPLPGVPATVQVQVRNHGLRPTSAVVSLYAGGDLVDQIRIEQLAPEEISNIAFRWQPSPTASENPIVLEAYVSAAADETLTADNICSLPVALAVEPVHDVALQTIRVEPAEFAVGEQANIAVTLANQGHFDETDVLVSASVLQGTPSEQSTVFDLPYGNHAALTFPLQINDADLLSKTTLMTLSATAQILHSESNSANNAIERIFLLTPTGNGTISAVPYDAVAPSELASAGAVTAMAFPTVATPSISPAAGTFINSVQVTLSCSTAGATIRYTTDGTDPVSFSPVYTAPFTLNASRTVKARGFKDGYFDSGIAFAFYTITVVPQTVAVPTIAPHGGTFTGSAQVTLSCSTSGAAIRYTTDGTNPTTGSPLYSAPITVTDSCTLKARGFKTGFTNSAVASANFTINPAVLQVAAPVISPNGGTFDAPTQVTLSCSTEGAVIRYTKNGTEPISSSPLYAAPFTLNVSRTVKARAFKSGYLDSPIVSAAFTIDLPVLEVAAPVISPNGGTFGGPTQVTLSCATAGATIRYTKNGSDPTSSSPVYSVPFTLSASRTVKARAFKNGYTDSPIASATIIINPTVQTVATPAISPHGGSFTGSTQVTLSCATSGAAIRYTTDGTDPTSFSTLYSAPVTLNSSCTLRARGFKSGCLDSAIASAGFTINPVVQVVAAPGISPNGGTFADPTQVTLSCSTAGAAIRFTTDGSDPTSSSPLYAAPFIITDSCTVRARGFKDGFTDSAVAAASFIINPAIQTVAAPAISPNGGQFTNSAQVTLSCATAGAAIRYTTNGTDPVSFSPLYSAPVTLNSSCTLKARAFKSGCLDSAIASAAFTITVLLPPAQPASIDYPASSGTGSYTVTWAAAAGAAEYRLQRYNGTAWTLVYAGPNLSYNETVANGSYRYRVKAFNSAGSSAWRTGTGTCVVTIVAPAAPASIVYPSSSATGQYDVTWAASPGATQYRLQRYNGAAWTLVYTGPNLSFSETITDGVYRYRVKASNTIGSSPWRTGGYDCYVIIPEP